MKKITTLILSLCALSLTACAPARIIKIAKPGETDKQAQLTIYRESVLINARGAAAIVAFNQQELLELKNAQYTKFSLPQGEYQVYVRSEGGDQPNKQQLTLDKDICLKVSPNSSNLMKALFFAPAMLLSSTFSMNQAPCLNDQELSKYEFKPFNYID